ncbi:MAG: hypothetical protein D6694_15650, partial [Gammaproteobacteria bacterium]
MNKLLIIALLQLHFFGIAAQNTFLKSYFRQNGNNTSFNTGQVNQMAIFDSFFVVDARYGVEDLYLFKDDGTPLKTVQFLLPGDEILHTTNILSEFDKVLYSGSLDNCYGYPEEKCGVIIAMDENLELINARLLPLHHWINNATSGFLDEKKILCTYADYDTLQNTTARKVPVVAVWNFLQDSVLWAKKFVPQDEALQHGYICDITHDSDGFLHVAGYFVKPWGQTPLFLMKLDSSANFIQGIQFPLFHPGASQPRNILLHYLPQDNSFLLSGRITDPGHHFQPITSANPEGFIAKIDQNYQVEWAFRLHAPYFPCLQLTTIPSDNDEVLFIYTAYGELPVMIGRMDFDGT